jgi:hypothetical protein
MRRNVPDELTEVFQGLNPGSQLTSFQHWSMEWIAELSVHHRRFMLVADRGYIDVSEVVDGKQKTIHPPENQRASISPAEVRLLLSNAVG